MDTVLEDRLLDEFLPQAQDQSVVREHFVTALLISHGGATWLPRTIAAVKAQSRPADLLICGATSSDELSVQLLGEAFGEVQVLAPDVGQAGGLAQLASGAPVLSSPDPEQESQVSWLWLLHDDTAPDPDCLAELLAGADRVPQAAVLVPKALAWSGEPVIKDIGRLWVPGDPQVNALDAWEHDQGQHDDEREVYTGGSGGMLVRADLWHWLGGPDPDAGQAWVGDLCRRTWGCGWEVWVQPSAVIAHRQAGQNGLRPGTSPRQARAARRDGQLYLELTQSPRGALPWRVLRAALSTMGRFSALALTRELDEALGELDGAWSTLSHPSRIRRGRQRAREEPVASLTRPPALRAPSGTVVRHWLDGVMSGPGSVPRMPRPTALTWVPVGVFLALLLVMAMRNAPTLLGSGKLQGGGLLPAGRLGSLLSDYAAGWHEVGVGSGAPMPGYVALLAVGSLLTLGSVDALLRLLVTLYVPLAFGSAYLAIATWRVGRNWSMPLRLGAALCYSVLPAGLAAAASGRLSTLALGLLGPWVVRLLAWALRPGPGRLRPAIWAGLALGGLASFAPVALALGVLWALGAVAVARDRVQALRVTGVSLLVALLPMALVLPALLRAPGSALFEVGVNDPDLLGSGMPPWFELGLSPGGPGAPAPAAGLLLSVVAVVAALLRPRGRALAWLGGWAGAAAGAALLAAVPITYPASGQALTPWPGAWLLVAGGCAVMATATALAPDGPARNPAGTALSQDGRRVGGALGSRAVLPLAGALAAAGVLMAVMGWVAPPGAVSATSGSALPAVAAADSQGPARTRSLVLRRGVGGLVEYYLANGHGATLGDADVARPDPQQDALDAAVSGLVSGSGIGLGELFSARAVAYFVFTGEQSDPAVAALDATAGLRRLAGTSEQSLWLVTPTRARAELADPGGQAPPVAVPVSTVPTSVDAIIHPQLAMPRVLYLAERDDPGWRVTLDGQSLARTAGPLVVAAVPGPGRISAWHESPRGYLVAAQTALVLVALLLALPKRRVSPEASEAAVGEPEVPDGQ